MAVFNDGDPSSHSKEECGCKVENSCLHVPRRHLGWMVAFFIGVLFFVFISGYFWGRKSLMEGLVGKIEQDSFADRIYSSMGASQDFGERSDGGEGLDNGTSNASPASTETTDDVVAKTLGSDVSIVETKPDIVVTGTMVKVAQQEAEPKKDSFVGHLVGFRSKQEADKFASRQNNRGISVAVRTRSSKTKSGKTISWYQAVTEPVDDKNELIRLVTAIKRAEHIKNEVPIFKLVDGKNVTKERLLV